MGRLESALEDLWGARPVLDKSEFDKELNRLEAQIQDRKKKQEIQEAEDKAKHSWIDQDTNPELERVFFEANLALKNKDKMFAHFGVQHLKNISYFLEMRPWDYFLRLLRTELLDAFVWDARSEIKMELERLIEQAPNNPIAYVSLAQYLRYESQFEQAIKLLSMALEQFQDQDLFELTYGAKGQVFSRRASRSGIFSMRAYLYEKIGQYENALADHEKTSSLYPGDEKMLLDRNLARCRDQIEKLRSSSAEVVSDVMDQEKKSQTIQETRLPSASLADRLLYLAHDQARQTVEACPNFLSQDQSNPKKVSAYQTQNFFFTLSSAQSTHSLSSGAPTLGICYLNGTDGMR